MKALIFCSILIAVLSEASTAQYVALDTIFVSNNKTTYLVFGHVFNSDHDFIDIGTPGFQSKIEGETVFLKASASAPKPTTLMIKNGQTYFHGIIGYQVNPNQTFYDFRVKDSFGKQRPVDHTLENSTSYDSPEDIELAPKEQLILKRLEKVIESKVKIHTLGVVKDRITLALTNVMTDKSAIYMKLLFHNRSSGDYQIDFVNFQFIEPAARKGLKKGSDNITDVYPIEQTANQNIDPYQKVWLGYALPLFNLTDKGKLLITFRETNGSRLIALSVPAKVIAKAEVF